MVAIWDCSRANGQKASSAPDLMLDVADIEEIGAENAGLLYLYFSRGQAVSRPASCPAERLTSAKGIIVESHCKKKALTWTSCLMHVRLTNVV